MAPYEESVRVPMWIMGGKNLDFRSGVVETRSCLHLDHAPTFLDLAGFPAASFAYMDGRSLLPLLKNNRLPAVWRNSFVQEYIGGSWSTRGPMQERKLQETPINIPYELQGALVKFILSYTAEGISLDIPTHNQIKVKLPIPGTSSNQEFAYIEWPNAGLNNSTEYELYNVTQDPYQLNNLLFFRPIQCANLKALLQEELNKVKGCKGMDCSAAIPASRQTLILNAAINCKM